MKAVSAYFPKTCVLCSALIALLLLTIPLQAVTVAWDPNSEPDLAGYNVYYGELNANPTRIDVGLRTSCQVFNLLPGKTYYFYATAYNTSGLESAPSEKLTYIPPPRLTVGWDRSPSLETAGYNLYFGQAGGLAQKIKLGTTLSTTLTSCLPGLTYYFYVTTYNVYGLEIEQYPQVVYSIPTNLSSPLEIYIPRPSSISTARYLGRDSVTMGSWKGKYGLDGHMIIGNSTRGPGSLAMWATDKNFWVWENPSFSLSALEYYSDTNRIAACWFNSDDFKLNLAFKDTQYHKVSIYLVDFENVGIGQAIDIVNLDTGWVLDTRNISNFQSGTYLSWQVSGRVGIRVRRLFGPHAVLSGVFFEKPTLY